MRRLLNKIGWEKLELKKIQKIFKLELAKQKIGDILRIRCVLSATRLINKAAESGSKKKLKNFWKRACKNKNRWYIKKLLLLTGQADWKLNSAM